MGDGFDYTLDFARVDFRRRPDLYRVGRGEQGVLLVEPYKGEILPHWRLRTPEIARESADKIFRLYEAYRAAGDFVGMDMARKFLQMGWTRSLRYFNHRTGRKYVGPVPPEKKGRSGAHGRAVAPPEHDPSKLECAKIFRRRLDEVLADPAYAARLREHKERYEAAGDERSGRRAAARPNKSRGKSSRPR